MQSPKCCFYSAILPPESPDNLAQNFDLGEPEDGTVWRDKVCFE